jgi:peptidyl-dipeptidase Dcp
VPKDPVPPHPVPEPETGLDASNPFARPSELPFELPPFDRVREEHYRPAFEAGMAQQRAEVEAVASDGAEPTFANTVEALERSGRLLARAGSVFFNLSSSDSTPGIRDLEAELAPRLAAHRDSVYLDPRLFRRIASLVERGDSLGLDREQSRLLERYHTDFVRAGAALPAEGQARLREINEELSGLTTAFSNRLLAEANDLAVHVLDRSDLDGLSDDAVGAAEQAARARGLDKGFLLPLALPTAQPALASLRGRALRERIFRAATVRGLRGNENDTRDVLTRIVALRAERAALLGFADHASYVVDDETAKTLDAVSSMLGGLVAPAVANARTEAAELEAALVADGESAPLQPWDWAYYAERVRRERFDVDTAALRPYFEVGRVLEDGVFFAAGRLYGVSFSERTDLPVYHPDVRVFEVRDGDGSTPLGLFLCDWFARDSKRGGAWMSTFVDQASLLGTRPVVVVNLNVPRPADGEPALMTTEEVDTAFHEFGHALHGLFSDVRYPRFSGTSVPRDFVEFPSQVNEMWAWWPEVLANYAVHHRTGEPLPQADVDRLLRSRSYGEGFKTTEYLAAALLDQEWHRLSGAAASVAPQDVEAFEQAALERLGLALPAVPPRYRSTYFAHVFAGGYSAGYYGYIWSEVLDADTVDWFTEHGGLRRENGDAFRTLLLSVGGSRDPMEAFVAVRGREPHIEPLLRRRGLAPGLSARSHSSTVSPTMVAPSPGRRRRERATTTGS